MTQEPSEDQAVNSASAVKRQLQQAMTAHNDGRLNEAESLYRHVIAADPRQPDASYNLGMLMAATGDMAAALPLLRTALEAAPQEAQYWLSYIEVLMAAGQTGEARSILSQGQQRGLSGPAVDALAEHLAGANQTSREAIISDLVARAEAQLEYGRSGEAEKLYGEILALDPAHADSLHQLGIIANQTGRTQQAESLIHKAISANPDIAAFHYNLGLVLQDQQRIVEAITCYEHALQLAPSFPEALCNLGILLNAQGRKNEAKLHFEQALAVQPDLTEAHSNLGAILLERCDYAKAVFHLQKALAIDPQFADAYCNLGNAYRSQHRLSDSIEMYRRALAIKPKYAEANLMLGVALASLGKPSEAMGYLEKALAIKPDSLDALAHLGYAFMMQGNVVEAIANYRRVLDVKPDLPAIFSSLLFALQYAPGVTPEALFREHRRYADQFEGPFRQDWPTHRNPREVARRLKIGYVSGDFYNHTVCVFIEPILAQHDKSQVEVYCYYNNPYHDSTTERLMTHADHWLACAGMSDAELAKRIGEDGIDILVDLSGHTGHNRLPVFARKPAPVQVTWIGNAGTTGLDAMDYRLTDSHMDPPGLTERFHTEKLVRLPDIGAAYQPVTGCPDVTPLPALSSGQLMLASLNNVIKINQRVADVWAKILQALPHARLMLGNAAESSIAARLLELFRNAGVGPERLILQERMPLLDYLALHQTIDLALDPFPYNGGTTTVHSLWMGVPVVTLAGNTPVSRVGASALALAGLENLITTSEDEYMEKTIALANDLPRLALIRQSLRDRMNAAHCDPATITRHLESAFRHMWQSWCEK